MTPVDQEELVLICRAAFGKGADYYEGYCTQLDPSQEAGFRRRFYRLSLAMFCAWAYRVQIWKPTAFERSRESMRAVLGEILNAG